MKKRNLDLKCLKKFETYMRNEEKSAATIEKYMRDLRGFFAFLESKELSKETVLEYKEGLIRTYAVASANSMLAALNSFFRFLGVA